MTTNIIHLIPGHTPELKPATPAAAEGKTRKRLCLRRGLLVSGFAIAPGVYCIEE
jgi:hypothetical protein